MKKFEEWCVIKSGAEKKLPSFNFDEREIWWVSIGENIGEEICGKNDNFERPVLVLKKLSSQNAFVLPITSTVRKGSYFCNLVLNEKERSVLLHQGRFISKKRMLRRIEIISENKFNFINRSFIDLYKIETPSYDGDSQAPYGEDNLIIANTN